MRSYSNDKVSASQRRARRALTMTNAKIRAVAATLTTPATIIEAQGQQMKGGRLCIDS